MAYDLQIKIEGAKLEVRIETEKGMARFQLYPDEARRVAFHLIEQANSIDHADKAEKILV